LPEMKPDSPASAPFTMEIRSPISTETSDPSDEVGDAQDISIVR